jgi:hypothetical protein
MSEHGPTSACPSRTPVVAEIQPKAEVRAHEKVLIAVDPHKASVAVAAVDEVAVELVERASFPQNRVG